MDEIFDFVLIRRWYLVLLVLLVVLSSCNKNNNQITMTDATGTTARTYDALNRVLTKDVPSIGKTVFFKFHNELFRIVNDMIVG